MNNSIVSYDLEMALEHMKRARARFPSDEEPYFYEWISHCMNELKNCYDGFLNEYFPENRHEIVKETRKDVKEYFRKT